MSFFEPLPPPPRIPPRPQPPWVAPPRNELAVGVPAEILLARTENAAVSVGGIRVFSTGFELALSAVVRPGVQLDDVHGPRPGRDAVRFGLRCVDGTRAEVDRARREEQARKLVNRGGGGDGSSWVFRYWSWPLPPPGPIELFCLWERVGIAESSAVLDAAPILEAAARVERLWPEEEAGEGRGGSWSSFTAQGEG